jgi:hypothetical protein
MKAQHLDAMRRMLKRFAESDLIAEIGNFHPLIRQWQREALALLFDIAEDEDTERRKPEPRD